MKIIQDILKKITDISKPQQKFIGRLLYTMLAMGGRVNFRNLSRYMNYDERTIARQFGRSFNYLEFNLCAMERIHSSTRRYAIAYDPVFISKSGKKTYGSEKFWNGSKSKAELGIEGNGFAVIDVDKKTAYPLAIEQTPPKKDITEALGFEEATRLDFYVSCAKNLIQNFTSYPSPFNINHLIVDAYFAKNKFVSMVLNEEWHIVSKLRSDANLRYLEIPKNQGRGRPRKYGLKVDVTDQNSFTHVCSTKKGEELYEGTFYSMNLKHIVKVAYLTKKHKKKTGRILLFSTDLTMSAQDILDYYSSRFQIEFIFRDGKQFLGFSDCQARSKIKIHNHLNVSLSTLLLAKIMDVEQRGKDQIKVPFSMATHKTINYNEMLTKRIFENLDLDQSLIKSDPRIRRVIETGAIRC